MEGSIRERLRVLARSGKLGRRASAAPVVVVPAPSPVAPPSAAADHPDGPPSGQADAPAVKRLDRVD